MDRARRAGLAALIVLVVAMAALGPAHVPHADRFDAVPAAAVDWPVSTLVVAEVQTGGTSASDEFVEIANQGDVAVDLAGLEIAYVTGTGTTVTRKAVWTAPTSLEPGRRILVANAAGIYAAVADARYSGGFSATGGAIVLRPVGGGPVDAVGWGDALNTFVEGTAAPAAPAGSSLERLPGGAAGNGSDTNDNAADWFIQGAPSPQGLGAPPVPAPGATPAPTSTATATPSATATATATPAATAMPTATATPAVTASPTPTPTSSPTETATLTPAPTPTPGPAITSIAEARGAPDGTIATIAGILTMPLGAVEGGRGAFIQDATGGIALYLDQPATGSWPAATLVQLTGTTASRYGQRTLKLEEGSIVRGDSLDLPEAITSSTGSLGEDLEGWRVTATGTTVGSPGALADGLGVTIDDGSGQVRAVIGPDALSGSSVPAGTRVTVVGPLGQRDSSGTGTAGYRIHATLAGELVVLAPDPTPAPIATPAPSATPTATPKPTATPAPTPALTDPATARLAPVGARVTVRATVLSEVGRLGSAPLVAIGDARGGILVRVPEGVTAPARGTLVEVNGPLAAPYGQLEIRPATSGYQATGPGSLSEPTDVPAGGLDERLEARLVSVTGIVAGKPARSGNSIVLTLERPGQSSVRVMADLSSGLDAGSLEAGATYRLTGIVGQRASHKDAPDGYRLWLRDRNDVRKLAGPSPSAGPGGSGSATGAAPAVISIASALRKGEGTVAIAGVVTAPSTLLDATGRRVVIQDATAAVEVLLPAGTAAPPVGTRLRLEGRMARAYGAPRIQASRVTTSGTAALPSPLVLGRPPTETIEWRLVRVQGKVTDVSKLGDRWRAELAVRGTQVVIVGQAGAGIAHDTLVEGRSATVTGIVRRPYPTASDQRFTILPRFPADIRVAAAGNSPDGRRSATTGDPVGGGLGPDGTNGGSTGASIEGVPDVDLADLAAHRDLVVRVGGLIMGLEPDGFRLDDGTATGTVVVAGEAAELLPLIEPGDALNATGLVDERDGQVVVVVTDPAGLVLATNPLSPAARASAAAGPGDGAADGAATIAGVGELPWGGQPGIAGLGTLLAISIASLAVTGVRRWQTRRRLAVRVAARLASLASSAGPLADGPTGAWDPPQPPDPVGPDEPRSAEHASRTNGSA